jgi:hypothetical protein
MRTGGTTGSFLTGGLPEEGSPLTQGSDKPVSIYEYHENRAGENVLPFPAGFSGYPQSDGWGSYATADEIF